MASHSTRTPRTVRPAPAAWRALLRRRCRRLALLCAALLLLPALVAAQAPAAALRERYAVAMKQGGTPGFGAPLAMSSAESDGQLHGEVYALIAHPFSTLQQALGTAERWCDVLILHLNIKYCRAVDEGRGPALAVGIGRKFDQPLSSAHWARFAFKASVPGAEWLFIELQAPTGPMGTHDYRIALQATPLDRGQTVVHLRYSYGSGTTARWALQAYLATLAADKVGFSTVGRSADGQPLLVDGLRGVVERNTLRYYLAIEATLAATGLPAAQQLPASLKAWFDATERHARQLHEMERDEYLQMKLREVQRQRTEPPPPP